MFSTADFQNWKDEHICDAQHFQKVLVELMILNFDLISYKYGQRRTYATYFQ